MRDAGDLRQQCLSLHLDTPYAGRLGRDTTFRLVNQTYVWPSPDSGFFFFFFSGLQGNCPFSVNDEGSKRTWFEPEQGFRKPVPKRSVHGKQSPQEASKKLFFLGYRGIVHPPSDDGGTERTWFVPEHRPRKHFLSDQFKASKMSTLC